jgi:hypothetical protein
MESIRVIDQASTTTSQQVTPPVAQGPVLNQTTPTNAGLPAKPRRLFESKPQTAK